MALSNSRTQYGSVAMALHWSLALGILAMLALGRFAVVQPADTSAQILWKAQLFTAHKTAGVILLGLSLARIAWALTQPRPLPISTASPVARLVAQIVHWLLHLLLILIPLSGWVHHAATTGFAPIASPFGQSLPFVPRDPVVAAYFRSLHVGFIILLVPTLALHVAGALKHHLFDKDDTLRRMLPGCCASPTDVGTSPATTRTAAPAMAAAILATAIVLSSTATIRSNLPTTADTNEARTALAGTQAEPQAQYTPPGMDIPHWQVESGDIAISIRQLGTTVRGHFAEWSAEIRFAPVERDGHHGSVDVSISVPSLTLGSVTATAQGPAYFNATAFPEARFEAELLRAAPPDTYLATGTLTIKDNTVPMSIPFTLDTDGVVATATLRTTLDRRDFEIGLDQTEEGTLGFGVEVAITLSARKAFAP